MFAKQSLKNRFKTIENKLTDQSTEQKQESIVPDKSKFPELHARLKADSAQEEELSFYLRSIKKSFNRVAIKEASENHLAFENEIARLINGFTKNPCLIQIIHPQDQKGLDNFKLFILALNETQGQWRLLFKDLSWIGVSFASATLQLTFDQNQMELNKVEGLLKVISSKSNHLLSFNIQKRDDQFVVGLRLEANIIKKISTERDTAL